MSTSSLISMILILTFTLGGFIFLARLAFKSDRKKKEMNG